MVTYLLVEEHDALADPGSTRDLLLQALDPPAEVGFLEPLL